MRLQRFLTFAGAFWIILSVLVFLSGVIFPQGFGILSETHNQTGQMPSLSWLGGVKGTVLRFAGLFLFGFGLLLLNFRSLGNSKVLKKIIFSLFLIFTLAVSLSVGEIMFVSRTLGDWLLISTLILCAGAFGYFYLTGDNNDEEFTLNFSSKLHRNWLKQLSETAAQQERARLARDLHDSVKQQIFVININAATVKARWDSDPEGAKESLENIRQSASEAMTEMEAMLLHLRPDPLENIGLIEAIRKQAETLKYRTGAKVNLDFHELPESDRFPPGTQEEIFRIAQEACSNIARHARAGEVSIRLYKNLGSGAGGTKELSDKEVIVLEIDDNGKGFDASDTSNRGMGISNMRNRTAELDGILNLGSKIGMGTNLKVTIPLIDPSSAIISRLKTQTILALVLIFFSQVARLFYANEIVKLIFVPVFIFSAYKLANNFVETHRSIKKAKSLSDKARICADKFYLYQMLSVIFGISVCANPWYWRILVDGWNIDRYFLFGLLIISLILTGFWLYKFHLAISELYHRLDSESFGTKFSAIKKHFLLPLLIVFATLGFYGFAVLEAVFFHLIIFVVLYALYILSWEIRHRTARRKIGRFNESEN